MDSELPLWLNSTFLATALQGGENQEPSVTVKKFSTTPAVAAGNNFISRLYRVKVDYGAGKEEHSTSLILKVPFTKSAIEFFFDQSDLFGKEPIVYNEILPLVNSITGCEFGPKSFYSSVINTLIISDLKEQDYEMCDRHKQLDFAHCKEVLKSLANFHAGSVACKNDHSAIIERAGKEILYIKSDRFEAGTKPWIQGCFKAMLGVIGEMQLGKAIEDFIFRKAESAADSAVKTCKPKALGLNVLNHGDLWTNNVLFKHTSSGDIVDLKFIDFQLVRYATPATDLLYFFWTSANEDVRESHIQELCEIYRETLNATLERLGCEERLTGCELKKDFKASVDWALITVSCLLPIMVSENDTEYKLEEMIAEDFKHSGRSSKFFTLYNGKHLRALLPKIMKHLLVWASSL